MSGEGLLRFALIRVVYFFATIFTAFSLTYLLLRLMPVNAVENVITQITAQGMIYDPEALNILRRQLYEIFGLVGSPWEQYLRYLRGVFTLDFGPSILAFPTPAKSLVVRYLPWTIGLLFFTTIISWVIGNLLGMLSALKEESILSKILQGVAVTLYPIPYYVMALVLIFLLAYLIPIFPLSGSSIYMERLDLGTVLSILRAATLPALSIVIVSALGWWFLSSRTLTLRVKAEDYVEQAYLRGLPEGLIVKKYIMRNILLPQVTALGLALGTIFSGAVITEAIFAYPGLGLLLFRAISTGDYSTALSIVSLSIYGVALGTLILDLIYPLIDPRVGHR
ncbi:ABC transporter permease [Infirmifilum lucidum]|uniref:ABC transporter permease n=1 Tax=Infirmifilum lucidum TaxID=2776706 RepID=A0A7L9FGF7_9CREN|nr:ABC transporter permease [Infirmifilum lucidum]QOJ78839.1 ABC transporter permease [Infirmifilum lucidum]